MNKKNCALCSIIFGILLLPASSGTAFADAMEAGWASYNRTLNSDRFSPLTGITARNAGDIAEACEVALGDDGAFQAGPLVIGDTLFVTTEHTTVALNAADCVVRWRNVYRPEEDEAVPVNRGAAYLDGRLFRGTGDGRILAIDATNGREVWRVRAADPKIGENFSAAPIAWKGLVFIGPSGGDMGIRGRVMAFDAATGKEVWRFDTIPMGSEAGADTWHTPESQQHGGGATWSSYTLDAATGELFVSVGNPAPDYLPSARPGTNLYTNALVVLDAKTGVLKWYYQLDPGDGLDYDLGAAATLYTDRDGRGRIALGSKDGHLYLLDRKSHRLISKTAITTILNADKSPTPEGILACPGTLGGVEWNGPAHDPATRKVYVGAVDWCSIIKSGASQYLVGLPFIGTSYAFPPQGERSGWITAVDEDTGKTVWHYHAKSPVLSGVTPTAGGVIFTGEEGGDFLVLDANSGKLLKAQPLGGSMAGGVVTYDVHGKQYIAAAVGNISRSGFSAAKQTPRIVIMTTGLGPGYQPSKVSAAPVDEGSVLRAGPGHGEALFVQYCALCHGTRGTGGFGPSLVEGERKDFPHLVQWLKNPDPPMPKLYPDPLNEEDIDAIAQHVQALTK